MGHGERIVSSISLYHLSDEAVRRSLVVQINKAVALEQTEVLNVLTAAMEQVGPQEAAALTVGHLQVQLGMTKPLSDVRKEIERRKHSTGR